MHKCMTKAVQIICWLSQYQYMLITSDAACCNNCQHFMCNALISARNVEHGSSRFGLRAWMTISSAMLKVFAPLSSCVLLTSSRIERDCVTLPKSHNYCLPGIPA